MFVQWVGFFFFKQTILYCSHNLQFIVQCKISKLTYFIIAHEFTQKSNINAPPLSLFSSFDAFQKCLFISEKKSDFNQVEIFGSQIDAMSVDEGGPLRRNDSSRCTDTESFCHPLLIFLA